MGIGNSRSNAVEGEVVPPKIRHMLVGKYEDFKKRRNAESNLSKKKLLNEAQEEDDNSRYSRDRASSPFDIQPPRVVPVPNSECQVLKDNHPLEHMDPNQDNMNHALVLPEAVEEANREIEQQVDYEDDDHNDDNDDVGRIICPGGSPSFRIYCIENDKRDKEECNNSPTKAIVVHQKSHSADSIEMIASTKSSEVLPEVEIESVSTTKRKGNKKKFGAMRTLLKVKSCYHPIRNCTGNDGSLVVAAKAAK